jgi:hypothetical protein
MRGWLAAACVALFLAAGGAASAAEIAGSAVLRVSPSAATVGDRLDAVLEVTLPEGYVAERPDVGLELGSFTVFEPSWEGPVAAGGKVRFTLKARLAAFETGTLEVPSVEVRVQGAGAASVLKSEPVKVEIRSVLSGQGAAGAAKPDLSDLKPPATIPPDYRPLWVALGILGALAAAAGAAWWIHRRLASKLAAVAAPEDPFRRLPPHVWAYAELKRLLDRRLSDEGEIELFFAELSRILKLYLGGRYRVPLMESTTAEVPGLLAEAGAPREAARSARVLLERSDGVKFARELPDPARCRNSVDEAYRIVDATRPAEEPAAAGEPGAAEKGAA